MTTIAKSAIIRGAANINNLFTALVGKRSELVGEINLALVSSIAHAHEHGDVTVLNQWAGLYSAKTTGYTQIMGFIRKFAPAKFQKDVGEFKLDRNKRVENTVESVDGEMVTKTFLDTELGETMLSSSYTTLDKPAAADKPEVQHNASMTAWKAVESMVKNLEKQGVSLNADQMAALNLFKDSIKEDAKAFVLGQATAKAETSIGDKFN